MASSNNNTNRRRHIRVKPEKTHPIGVDINGDGFIDMLKAIDISIGGIRSNMPHMFEGCRTNRTISVVISLPTPGCKSFLVDGKIGHIDNKAFGIQFLGLEEAHRKMIKTYIASRLKEEPWGLRIKQQLGWI